MKLEELEKTFSEKLSKIDDVKLFFECKKQRLLKGRMEIKGLKNLMVLVCLKLPITTSCFSFFNKTGTSSAINYLHRCGDQHLLIWKRVHTIQKGNPFEWVAAPLLLNLIDVVLPGEITRKEDSK
jgi:hypothetical protein